MERERLYCLASFCCRLLCRRFNAKHIRGGFTVALKVSLHKSPAMYRAQALKAGPNIKAACNKNLSVSPQQSAQIAPILANEGQKVITIRNNNSLSNVQKTQEVTSLQKQSDSQLKAVLSSAQYDKLKVVRYQAVRWVTQKRLGWQ